MSRARLSWVFLNPPARNGIPPSASFNNRIDTSNSSTVLSTVAVGTALTGGPPRRSQRAELPHWAPALGTDVKSHFGERMHHAGGG
jgi:hypothetical protein